MSERRRSKKRTRLDRNKAGRNVARDRQQTAAPTGAPDGPASAAINKNPVDPLAGLIDFSWLDASDNAPAPALVPVAAPTAEPAIAAAAGRAGPAKD
jgi:hypothetical protein